MAHNHRSHPFRTATTASASTEKTMTAVKLTWVQVMSHREKSMPQGCPSVEPCQLTFAHKRLTRAIWCGMVRR